MTLKVAIYTYNNYSYKITKNESISIEGTSIKQIRQRRKEEVIKCTKGMHILIKAIATG